MKCKYTVIVFVMSGLPGNTPSFPVCLIPGNTVTLFRYLGCIYPCCRFLTSLIRAAPTRLGKNGVGEVMASTWLAGFPWERIREVRAPYVTEGAARVKVSLPSILLTKEARVVCTEGVECFVRAEDVVIAVYVVFVVLDRSPRWTSGSPRMLLALVREFESLEFICKKKKEKRITC